MVWHSLAGYLVTSTLLCAGAVAEDIETIFVENGVSKLIREEGKSWKRGEGYIECSGTGNYLYAGKAIGVGDSHIKVRLTILELSGTAASFVIDGRSHFGFDGSGGRMFVQGRFFGSGTNFLDQSGGLIQSGVPFLFEIIRKGSDLTFLIDGKQVHSVSGKDEPLEMIGLRPWRSTMRVSEFSAIGEMRELSPQRTQPTTYSIPTIDLSRETWRQVIVESIPGQYLGHPTTVLLRDNKTILVTYPLGHGGPSAVLKKSTDGGLTWSERLPVPDNWKTATNCPCLHRLTGPDGVERLFVFEGNGEMRQSVSLDNGETWTPLEPNGLHCVVAPITIVPIAGGRHLAMYQWKLAIWQSISHNGGLTWDSQQMIAEYEGAHPCEPAVIRSPDGKQLAGIMRENTRRYNSMLIVSDDEGETWSKPVELPASLTGDRHMPRYSHDGRLVIPFRDTALGSPTKGDFVAWVGTYYDMVSLREGQYRVRLLDSPVKGDLGYPGLELLPDGTLIATTYAVLKKGEKQSVVSVRFKVEELDKKAAMLPKQTALFVAGKDGYHTYRIPAIVVSTRGTILAFCEGRRNSGSDTGDIDIVLKRSFDNGETWEPTQLVANDGPNTMGNPCPVVDRETATIWLPLTRNLGEDNERQIWSGTGKGTRTVWILKSTDDGATWSEPVEITQTTKLPEWTWYATGPGVKIQLRNGRMLIPCNHDLMVAGGRDCYSHVIYSDDHGVTWKLGGSTLGDNRTSECQLVELQNGSLFLDIRNYPCYRYLRATATSEDGGLTWSEVNHDSTRADPGCQASILRFTDERAYAKGRLLFSNPASDKREKMTIRLSYDEGETWPVSNLLHAGPSGYSCLTVLPDMSIICFYEKGVGRPCETVTLAKFSLEWLADAVDQLKPR